MVYKLSSYTDYRQLFLLIISILFDLVLGLFYWINSHINLYLTISIITIQIILNLINSFLYDINISGGKIHVKNLYKKDEIINGSEFSEIKQLNRVYLFVLLFSPPFYVFKLKNGRKYIFLSNSLKAIFAIFTFGLYSYTDKLNKIVNEKLTSIN